MLDFVAYGFVILSLWVLYWAIAGSPFTLRSDAVLIIVGETKNAHKATAGIFEFTWEDLKKLSVNSSGIDYNGPSVTSLLLSAGITYSSLIFYSAGSKKAQKLLQRCNVHEEPWIIAIERGRAPLSWGNGGPFLLLNRSQQSKRTPRLVRIEAK